MAYDKIICFVAAVVVNGIAGVNDSKGYSIYTFHS